jgi:uncharacterized coiled-coil protein SlyX
VVFCVVKEFPMSNTYPTPPAYTPGAGQGGYWYRPPFTPRFSIPQTFGEALSYEAQIHWLAGLCSDADSMLRTLSAMHCYYGTTSVDTSAFTAYEPFTYTDASIPEVDQPKVGDFVGLVCPDSDSRYFGKNALHIARVVEWGSPCNSLTLAWYYTVHDPTAWLANLESQIEALATRVMSLENRMTSAENRIETLEDTVGRHEDAITALQTSVSNLTTSVTNLEADLSALEAKHDADISRLNGRITDLSTKTAKTLADIVSKVYGGGKIDPATGAVTWGSAATIPVGNINLYSTNGEPSPSASAGIITHADLLDNDVWVK